MTNIEPAPSGDCGPADARYCDGRCGGPSQESQKVREQTPGELEHQIVRAFERLAAMDNKPVGEIVDAFVESYYTSRIDRRGRDEIARLIRDVVAEYDLPESIEARLEELVGPQDGCRCAACCEKPHTSDCAVHNMPAFPNGPCDCSAATSEEVHSIPVPIGWSPEQAWEAIKRGDLLTDHEPEWANIIVRDGKFVELCDVYPRNDGTPE